MKYINPLVIVPLCLLLVLSAGAQPPSTGTRPDLSGLGDNRGLVASGHRARNSREGGSPFDGSPRLKPTTSSQRANNDMRLVGIVVLALCVVGAVVVFRKGR